VLFRSVVQKSEADLDDEVRSDGLAVSALWVRPGVGDGTAWLMRATDGGTTDDDHKTDGRTAVTTTQFFALTGKNKPPKKFKKDDLIITINPFDFSYKILKVAQ